MQAPDEQPSILSATPGRVRLGLPAMDPSSLDALQAKLVELSGITRVETNDLTGNVLVHYDSSVISSAAVVVAVQAIRRDTATEPNSESPRQHSMATLKRPASARQAVTRGASLVSLALTLIAAESPLGLALAAADAIKLVASLSES